MNSKMLLLIVAIFALWCVACNDKHYTIGPPVIDPEVPKKCLTDPCLPGCPSHDFLCEEEELPIK